MNAAELITIEQATQLAIDAAWDMIDAASKAQKALMPKHGSWTDGSRTLYAAYEAALRPLRSLMDARAARSGPATDARMARYGAESEQALRNLRGMLAA